MSEDAQLQVVRGAPDDGELAALVAGLMAAATSAPAGPSTSSSSAWSDRRRQLRPVASPPPGPDSWRWSLRG